VSGQAAILLSASLALLACGPMPSPEASRASSAECVALYERYDRLERSVSTLAGRRDNWIAPIELMRQGQWIRDAGCITLTRDLAGMEALPAETIARGGAAIPPIYLHAGVVTNMADDARSTAFFSAHGAPSRSVGAAPLGRRIYVGPFATESALDEARDLAVRAGFRSPYPARF
jgi:hypothetical protein